MKTYEDQPEHDYYLLELAKFSTCQNVAEDCSMFRKPSIPPIYEEFPVKICITLIIYSHI